MMEIFESNCKNAEWSTGTVLEFFLWKVKKQYATCSIGERFQYIEIAYAAFPGTN